MLVTTMVDFDADVGAIGAMTIGSSGGAGVVVDVSAIGAMTIGTSGGAGDVVGAIGAMLIGNKAVVVVVATEAKRGGGSKADPVGFGARVAALETVRSCCEEQLTVKRVIRVLSRSSFLRLLSSLR